MPKTHAPLHWRLALCALAVAAGCQRTRSTVDEARATTHADAAAPRDAASDTPTPPALDASAAAPRTGEPAASARACALAATAETIDDGGGKPDEHGTTRLEDLRVVAEGDAVVVTWERQADFRIGDAWRAPVVATREGAGAFAVLELPVRAYACATSGHVAPLGADEHFVTWGVNNAEAFEIWRRAPLLAGPRGMETVKTPPARRRPTPRQSVSDFVASRGVALATTFDLTCDVACTCAGSSPPGLWVHSLSSVGARPAKVASPGLRDALSAAPALAMGDAHGVGAYRTAGALHLFWLDGAGAPQGAPIRVAEGDVGAPAVAIAGARAVVAWARRQSKTEPYALEWVALEHGARVIPPPRRLATLESAFAPAALTDGKDAVLAWTQGDAARRGAIALARLPLGGGPAGPALAVSSPDEANARDPELSGSVDAPVIAYAAFTRSRPGGVARLARATCAR